MHRTAGTTTSRRPAAPPSAASLAAALAVFTLFTAALRADPAPGTAPFEGRFEFRTYTKEDGLEDLSVECVLQDQTGFIWVGTDDGLFRFDGHRFRKFGHRSD